MMPIEEEGDDMELRAKLLAELEELARGGQAREMAGRLGKMPPESAESAPADMEGLEAGADEPIPGAEPDQDEGQLEPDGDEAGSKLDPSKLRMLLASMKSKG